MDPTNFEIGDFLGFGSDSNPLLTLIWILPIIIFVFYGQRIQLYVTSNEIKKSIKKLDQYRAESKRELIGFARACLDAKDDPAKKIGVFLDYFSIMPVDMDPGGIVPKVQHLVRSREDHTRRQVSSMLPGSGPVDLSKVQTLLEIASSLQMLYKIVNHLFLTAKKQNNFPLILPLQMMLPFLMEQAEALRDAIPAFKAGQPVGDGIGPMVVGRMMLGTAKSEVAFQTVCGESEFEGRRLYLMKAQGPASTVGRLGDGVKKLLADHAPDLIIMVDAALKMEGEDSATTARGFGAAIGGIGTERFLIEDAAAAGSIPILSIVIKQSAKEALGLMSRDVAEQSGNLSSQIREMMRENTSEGQSVLLIGVGNTMGVSQ